MTRHPTPGRQPVPRLQKSDQLSPTAAESPHSSRDRPHPEGHWSQTGSEKREMMAGGGREDTRRWLEVLPLYLQGHNIDGGMQSPPTMPRNQHSRTAQVYDFSENG